MSQLVGWVAIGAFIGCSIMSFNHIKHDIEFLQMGLFLIAAAICFKK